MDRVLLGKKEKNYEYKVDIISYTGSPLNPDAPFGLGTPGLFATVVVNETNISKFNSFDTVEFPAIAAGAQYAPQRRFVANRSITSDGYVQITLISGIHTEGSAFLHDFAGPREEAAVSYMNSAGGLTNVSESLRQQKEEYGLWVSNPSSNVLNSNHIQGGNVAFDSSDYVGRSVRVIQSGTFQIQCKKTYMGKKGSLELSSDEQMRANANYTKLYPFEVDVESNDDFLANAPKNANTQLYGFGEGDYPITGNGFSQENVQNVYCDYGTQTIKFNPPLPDHIKTPHISVFFAVGNSAGHFHPWYANVDCNDSDTDWQYANSQHCVHMDSAWFRGKWTFRERTIAPLGTDMVNKQFPSMYEPVEGEISQDISRWYSPGGASARGAEGNYATQFRVEKGGSITEPYYVEPQLGVYSHTTSEPDTGHFTWPGPKTSYAHGQTVEEGSWKNEWERTHLSIHNDISYNVGDTDLNSPSSLWGGMLKSFAGLQGLTYFANNTHLKLDGFMTPTHTPTPFETEIVKERIANPDSGTGTSTSSKWHPDAGRDFDPYGNYRKNVGWFEGVNNEEYEGVYNHAFANGFGMPYKEKLPRKFRTKYWDGSETEYEWWPIGHANGHFTISYATDSSGTVLTDPNRQTVKDMLQNEATAMHNEGLINSASVQFGHIPYDPPADGSGTKSFDPPYDFSFGGPRFYLDLAGYPVSFMGSGGTERQYEFGVVAAAYGDYNIIKQQGADPYHSGTSFLSVVNKGTRFPNQLPDTEAKGYPPNSQYEPGDAFLKTRTFQGQPTSLDSFWNSFSNNTSQWVSSNTPYGEFYYADGGYAMDHSPYFNYAGGTHIYAAEKQSLRDGSGNKCIKFIPSDWNVQRQSFTKHNWNGGNPKAAVGTEGRRFGFGGAGSAEALGGESEGVFDTYYGKYIVYDIEGGDTDA